LQQKCKGRAAVSRCTSFTNKAECFLVLSNVGKTTFEIEIHVLVITRIT
jgi:hypothetical protein